MPIQLTDDDNFYPIGTVAKQTPDATKKDALEGEEVTIYVTAGYKFNFDIDIAMDLAQSVGTFNISLWENGTMINAGNTIDGSEVSTYTFKDIVTKNEKTTFIAKVSADGKKWYDYCEIEINKRKQVVKDLDDYQELVKKHSNSDTPTNGNLGEDEDNEDN